MLTKIKFQVAVQMVFVFLLLIGSANALNISFQAVDLTDTTVGQDLWRYDYTVSDHTFVADTGFQIFFDYTLYADLDFSPPAPNADWDVLTLAIDPGSFFDGAYDAYALVDNASLADTFSVEFVWLGGGTPGAQFYDLYDGLTWDIIESGEASAAPVPEPATMLLLGTGLVGIAGLRKRFKK